MLFDNNFKTFFLIYFKVCVHSTGFCLLFVNKDYKETLDMQEKTIVVQCK